MQATYTKLRSGAWGVKLTGIAGTVPATVTVTKRDGSTKVERIADVVWKGDGAMICTLAASSPARPATGRSRTESTFIRRYGWDGVRGSSSYYSSGMYDEES